MGDVVYLDKFTKTYPVAADCENCGKSWHVNLTEKDIRLLKWKYQICPKCGCVVHYQLGRCPQ